jgi:hypothetical protein
MAMPEQGAPTPFAMADTGQLRQRLEDAGFGEIEIGKLEFTQSYSSFDQYWEITRDLAAPIPEAPSKIDEADSTAVRDGVREALSPFTADDGTLAAPACTIVASAVVCAGA